MYDSYNHRSYTYGYFNPDVIKSFVDGVNNKIDDLFPNNDTIYIFGHKGSGFALGMALYLSNPERYKLIHTMHLNISQEKPETLCLEALDIYF